MAHAIASVNDRLQAWSLERGAEFMLECGGIHKLTAATVMYTADCLNAILDHAVQVHGGTGYIWESEVNRLYRTIKLLEIGAGTTEVRKMIIAEELLKEVP